MPEAAFAHFRNELCRVLTAVKALKEEAPHFSRETETPAAGIDPQLAQDFAERIIAAAEIGDVDGIVQIGRRIDGSNGRRG